MGMAQKYERPVAWGTTGLPFEPAWCGIIEALGCVGRGLRRAAWGAAGGLRETCVVRRVLKKRSQILM
jgi:hypothetical protein